MFDLKILVCRLIRIIVFKTKKDHRNHLEPPYFTKEGTMLTEIIQLPKVVELVRANTGLHARFWTPSSGFLLIKCFAA